MAVSYRDQAVVYRPRSVVRLWKYLCLDWEVLVLYCLALFSENLRDRVCHVFLLNGLKADFWTRKIANTKDMWHPNRLHLKHSSRNGSKSVWRSIFQWEPFQFQGGYKFLFIIRNKMLKNFKINWKHFYDAGKKIIRISHVWKLWNFSKSKFASKILFKMTIAFIIS